MTDKCMNGLSVNRTAISADTANGNYPVNSINRAKYSPTFILFQCTKVLNNPVWSPTSILPTESDALVRFPQGEIQGWSYN